VELTGIPGGRRVHGHDRAETHAKRAEPGEPDRADGEVLVVGEDLDPDGRLRPVAVPGGHAVVRFLRDGGDIRREELGFLAVDREHEAGTALDPVGLERVQEVERVHRPRVVPIALEGAFEAGSALVHRADAQPVDAEQLVPAPREGIERDGPFREVDGLSIQAAPDAQLGERRVERCVSWIDREHGLSRAREPLGVSFQEGDPRRERERVQRARVHGQRAFHVGLRLLEVFQLHPEHGT
jgi:hypothetical protein